jgi:hypothetical protein
MTPPRPEPDRAPAPNTHLLRKFIVFFDARPFRGANPGISRSSVRACWAGRVAAAARDIGDPIGKIALQIDSLCLFWTPTQVVHLLPQELSVQTLIENPDLIVVNAAMQC